MRFSLRGFKVPTGICEEVTADVNQAQIVYNRAADAVVCNGLPENALVQITNLGGVVLAKEINTNENGQLSLSLKGQPLGTYLVTVKAEKQVRVHKLQK